MSDEYASWFFKKHVEEYNKVFLLKKGHATAVFWEKWNKDKDSMKAAGYLVFKRKTGFFITHRKELTEKEVKAYLAEKKVKQEEKKIVNNDTVKKIKFKAVAKGGNESKVVHGDDSEFKL
jgi:hypothetical protein